MGMQIQSSPRERSGALAMGAFAALAMGWVFLPSASLLVERWREDPGASHGPLVPLIAAFLLWQQRARLSQIPRQASGAGLAVLGVGLIVQILAAWADVQFLFPLSMLIALWGVVLYLAGWPFFRQILFPMVFLLFAMPWPDFLVESISFPLQLWTSTYAAMAAGMLGVPVGRDGVELRVGEFTLAVAAPCSGIRSLVALMAIAAVFGYLLPAPMWRRVALFLVGIPVALFANTIRVLSIVLIARYFGPKLALGFFHDYSSPFLFLLSCLGLMGLWKALECQTSQKNQAS